MNACVRLIPLLVLASAYAAPAFAGVLPPAPAGVEVTREYGIEFSTVGSPGNAPYSGDEDGRLAGRGGVGYEYRIGRTEVTTGQWLEFVNTFVNRTPEGFNFGAPLFWGAVPSGGGWELTTGDANAEMIPVYGITWRDAARFCNWLHNGKSNDLVALESGAYDTSTFTRNPDGSFNDQLTHSSGARFWIPTLDEWIKAGHQDPDRHGPSQPGWWTYSHRSDNEPIPGPPGVGQTSAGLPQPEHFAPAIPLGSYGDVQSAWGLLDLSGGASEWNEEPLPLNSPPYSQRALDGAWAGATPDLFFLDSIGHLFSSSPFQGAGVAGLRLAAWVPEPMTFASLFTGFIIIRNRRHA